MSHRVLVTGSNGQIGREVVAALRGRYGFANVVASDIEGVDVKLDACSPKQIESIVRNEKIDTLVHLAACRLGNDQHALRVNSRSIETVLEAARQHQLRVLLTSSTAVYGASSHSSEDHPARPDSIYGVSKVYGEMLGTCYSLRYGVDFRALRLPGVVSPRGMYVGANNWAVEIFQDALKKGHFKCNIAPSTKLPMIYIDDLTRGLCDFLEASLSNDRRVYNMNGFHATPACLAEAIDRNFPFAIDYNSATQMSNWPAHLDDLRARSDWGWRPRYGIHATARAMLSNIARDLHVDREAPDATCNAAA